MFAAGVICFALLSLHLEFGHTARNPSRKQLSAVTVVEWNASARPVGAGWTDSRRLGWNCDLTSQRGYLSGSEAYPEPFTSVLVFENSLLRHDEAIRLSITYIGRLVLWEALLFVLRIV
jgi:hypothetical protein